MAVRDLCWQHTWRHMGHSAVCLCLHAAACGLSAQPKVSNLQAGRAEVRKGKGCSARGSSRNDGSMQRQCEDTCTPRAATQHGHACCACQVSTCPTENAAKHRRQQHPDSPELHASLTAQPREGPALPCRRCPAACLMSAAEALHRPGSTTWTSRHKHSLTKHSRGQFDPARPCCW